MFKRRLIVFGIFSILLGSLILSGCTQNIKYGFMIPQKQFFQIVKTVAVIPILFNYYENAMIVQEGSQITQDCILEELKKIGIFNILPLENTRDLWKKTLKETHMGKFSNNTMSKFDKEEFNNCIKYFLANAKVDAGLLVTYSIEDGKGTYWAWKWYAGIMYMAPFFTENERTIPVLTLFAEEFWGHNT